MADSEFEAIEKTYDALSALNADAQQRVLDYVTSRLGLKTSDGRASTNEKGFADHSSPETNGGVAYDEFGELFDAVDPKTDPDKALTAAYWLTVIRAAEDFDSQSVNSHLKHLGHGIGNVTRALDSLVGSKPSLVIQTRKSGKSRQARKTFKVTKAGREWIIGKLGES